MRNCSTGLFSSLLHCSSLSLLLLGLESYRAASGFANGNWLETSVAI